MFATEPSQVLSSNLTAINAACEESARGKIETFRKQARYDGARFRCPSFQEVGQVWLELVQNKSRELISETKRHLDAMVTISEDQVSEVASQLEGFFRDAAYVDRMALFAESLSRKASSYGISFDPDRYGAALYDAAYRAGVLNLLRATREKMSNELQLYFSERGRKMGFSTLMTDTISVLKRDGSRFDAIKASVQTGQIYIEGSTPLIESGDLIQRKMSNGGEETFEVIDPGFHERFHGIPAGYQMQVRKLGIPEAQRAVQNITYIISGNNARLNQSSIDNSSNSVSINPDAFKHIEALRRVIGESNLSDGERQAAVEVVDAVDAQFKGGRPSKPVVTALLAALPHVANIATIVASLLALF